MQHAVLDLLLDVVLAVGFMDLNNALLLVDGGDINLGMEVLEGHREDVAFVAGGAADVVIAGIVPATDVHPGHELMGLEGGLVVGGLGVTIDVVALRSHLRVVHVAGVVPDLVLLGHTHVAHLIREEVLHDGLPDAAIIHVLGDAENRGAAVAVLDGVKGLLEDLGEIDLQVVVAEEIALPGHCGEGFDGVFAVRVKAQEGGRFERLRAAVDLDDRHLALVGQVSHLRGLDHGRIGPSRDHVRLDVPFYRSLGRPRGNLRPQYEPAVGVVHAAVV